MPRIISADSYEPSLQFRYKVLWTKIPGLEFYGKSVSLPSIESDEVKVDYGDTSYYVKGKTNYGEIKIDCYHYDKYTRKEVWEYFKNNLHDPDQGKDKPFPTYGSGQMTLYHLAPDTSIVGTYTIHNPWVKSIEFGNGDWGINEAFIASLTIRFDYFTFSGN